MNPVAMAAGFRRGCSWLLDIDGTLVHTDHLYRKVFSKLLTPLGHDVRPGAPDRSNFSLLPESLAPSPVV
jgi:phosphoglycolate phosphatase-like HAD superfamily hydrolase